MKAVQFPEVNHSFGKPPNMTDNQCYTLPVCRLITFIPGEDDKSPAVQVPAIVSCWELSDEEMAEVMKTRKVYVKILGTNIFPMSVHGVKPIYVDGGNLSDVILPGTQPKEPKEPSDPPPPPLNKPCE